MTPIETVMLESTITCPVVSASREEVMPTDVPVVLRMHRLQDPVEAQAR